jgi:hypothetical protein
MSNTVIHAHTDHWPVAVAALLAADVRFKHGRKEATA